MKLTIRHRYSFDPGGGLPELNSPAAWDEVRARDDVFGLPETRERWLADAAARDDLGRRAEAVVAVARGERAESICSYGVGIALFEQRVAEAAPELALTCTDFAPRAVERLAAYFREARVVLHDLRVDEPLSADLHVFHRLDTEFSDAEWSAIFARFHGPVLLLASELVGPRTVARELATLVRSPKATKAGWLRTEDSLRALWSATHDDERVEGVDLPTYLLTPR